MDREEPAVPLVRQTNGPKDNKKWKGLIETWASAPGGESVRPIPEIGLVSSP